MIRLDSAVDIFFVDAIGYAHVHVLGRSTTSRPLSANKILQGFGNRNSQAIVAIVDDRKSGIGIFYDNFPDIFGQQRHQFARLAAMHSYSSCMVPENSYRVLMRLLTAIRLPAGIVGMFHGERGGGLGGEFVQLGSVTPSYKSFDHSWRRRWSDESPVEAVANFSCGPLLVEFYRLFFFRSFC